MNTPPLLLGAALLFWGWQTGLLPVAAALACVLEGSRWIKARWQFSAADLHRIWNLCTFLFLGSLALAVLSDQGMALLDSSPRANSPGARAQALNRTARSVLLFFQWMPLVFFPMMAAQAYGQGSGLKWTTFSWLLRRRAAQNRELEEDAGDVNVSFAYFAVCILAASATNARPEYFYPGMMLLLAWALWTRRAARFAPVIAGVMIVTICAGGYAGNHGLRELQRLVTSLDTALLSRWSGGGFNPRENRSLLGTIGRIKASGKIVLWVKTDGKSPPPLLREASYDQFTSPLWHVAERTFNNVVPEQDQSTWQLSTNRWERSVEITRVMPGGRGLIAFPNGTVEFRQLPVFLLNTNTMATVLSGGGPGYLSYAARFAPGAGIDGDPTPDDAKVNVKEAAAIAQVAAGLNLKSIAREAPAEAIRAVENFFARHFTYSTYLERRERSERSALSRFLLEYRKGHCEYFAAATVLLLREAGIPARYAVGYSVQEGKGGKYVVRQRHAHAWCLAYVDGRWQDVDTTPPAWNQVESQRAPWWEAASDAWSSLGLQFSRLRWGGLQYRKYLMWSLLPALVGIAVVIYRRRQWRRAKAAPAEARGVAPGEDSEFYLVELRLRELGFERTGGESLRSWLHRVNGSAPANGVPLEELLALHYRYRFDPAGLEREEREALRERARTWLTTARPAA